MRAFARKSLAVITYKKIFKETHVANSLIGMSPTEFESLYAQFEMVHLARQTNLQVTRRDKLRRKRVVGGGRKHKYALRDRLLMVLFWLRAYTTYEVLGAFYELDKTTIEDNIKSVLDTLATMTAFHLELPCPEIPKLRSVQEVIEAFPDLCLILDPKE